LGERAVYQEVKNWIRDHPEEFTIDGEKDDGTRPEKELRYRRRILERCRQYDDAPVGYLKSMAKTIPKLINWYFNIFQAVFIAALVASIAAAAALAYNNFMVYLSMISGLPSSFEEFLSWTRSSFSSWISWVVPLGFVLAVLILSLKKNHDSGSSILSAFIQRRFLIIQNLSELKIELYYISKTIETRGAKKGTVAKK
jgi:hypothetical protein